MTLFSAPAFEAKITTLAHAHIVHQWGGASVGKVGSETKSKIFAILSSWSVDRPAIAFKCSEMSFDLLCTLEGVRPAPYLARAKWVQVQAHSALSEDEISAYIEAAHDLILASLPRGVRQRLTSGGD